jgi:hypothetical protein
MKKKRTKMTKKFMVSASFVSYCEIEVEADSLDEAKDIAYNLDGGDFSHSGYGDWNIDEVFELQEA